jgi:uncharacterized protein YceK
MNRLALIPVALLLSGCGTITDLGNIGDSDRLFSTPGPHIYGGVRLDAMRSAEPRHSFWDTSQDLAYCDMILLSVWLDTVLLPFTVSWWIFGPDPPQK